MVGISFPKRATFFIGCANESQGRAFIQKLLPYITSGEPWRSKELEKPVTTTNIAFTYKGLQHLGIPQKSLQSFPQEFVMGMKARRDILGDDGTSSPEHWDSIWQEEEPVDIWVSINGQTSETIEEHYQLICQLLEQCQPGVEQVSGHQNYAGDNLPYQDAAALLDADGNPGPKEHFGYTDGISDPYFKGSGRNPAAVVGGGKPTRQSPEDEAGWEPLETGEFILGYRDESQEYPPAPIPRLLSFNGTFMVYRKLHQNVGSFNRYLEEVGQHYPEGKTALMAKFAGRWPNGAPLTLFPKEADADAFMQRLQEVGEKRQTATGEAKAKLDAEYYAMRQKLVAFNFNDDMEGSRCPVGSHIRRVNPRGALEFNVTGAFNTPGALTNRRRVMRRGLPYGKVEDPPRDDGNHGIIMMVVGASIERQFEFVQQQWINYGNDFKLANEKDPLLGNHGRTAEGKGTGQMVIEAPENSERPPFFCAHMPRFVETRGGDYFFLPSLTAIRMIGEGIIDPT